MSAHALTTLEGLAQAMMVETTNKVWNTMKDYVCGTVFRNETFHVVVS